MATTTITFNGGSTTTATSNTSTTSNPSPLPSQHRDPLETGDDGGSAFHHHHHHNNNSVTSARSLVREKSEREDLDPEHEEDEEEEGEIRRRELVSESSVDSCSQEELRHYRRDDRAHNHGHGSSPSSVSRNKKRKQSRPIRIPCMADSSASFSPQTNLASNTMAPLNLSAKPNRHNGSSGTSSSMHGYMPFNLPMYQNESAGASASISPSSPSSSSNSNSEPESRSGGERRRRLSSAAIDLADRDGSIRTFSTSAGQTQNTASNHHHHHSHHRIFNPEAYCDLCNKEFCNKYFLKTHKANKHGVYSDVLPTQCQLPTAAAVATGQSGTNTMYQPQQQTLDTSSGSGRDSFCHLCNKDFCNKYFLRRHRAKIHGIQSSSSGGTRPGSGWTPDENESMEEGETTTRTESRKRVHHHGHHHTRDTESKGSSSSSTTSNCGLCGPSGQPHQHQHRHHEEHQHKGRGSSDNANINSSKKSEAMQQNTVISSSPPAVTSTQSAGAVFECSLCSHTFPSIYLLHMHTSYFHSTTPLPSVSLPFSHSTDSIVSSAAPMNYLGLKLCPSPSPPTTIHGHGLKQQMDASQAQDDDLRRLQSMILELSQGGGRTAAVATNASSVICPICCKEFYSSYFLSQHIATTHTTFSAISLPLPPPIAKDFLPSNQHPHQQHRQLKAEVAGDDEGVESKKDLNDENDDAECKNLRTEERQTEIGLSGPDVQGQNEMMMMVMMMNAGATTAASATGGLGLEDDESNNNMRESRNGHKKSRSNASRNPASSTSLLLQEPTQGVSGSGASASARVTPPLLPKSQKPVSPSLSRSYCTICHKELCNKYFMRTHMLKMHGINIESSTGLGGVTCDICHKELCSKYFLKVHKQNTHGIVEELGVSPMLTTPTPVGGAPVGTPESANGFEDETGSASGRMSQTESPSGGGGAGGQQLTKRQRGAGGKWASARTKGINGGGTASNTEDPQDDDEPRSRPQSNDNQEQRQIKQEISGEESPGNGNGEDGIIAGQFPGSNPSSQMLDPLSMLLQKMDGGSGKPLYCRYCPFTTSLLVYLYAHERTHTAGSTATTSAGLDSVQLQCPMCFLTYTQVEQFQQHIVSHQLGPANSQQSTTATASISQIPNIRGLTQEIRLSRHRINNNNEPEYKIDAETTVATPRKRTRIVRFKCSTCTQRFDSHSECRSHIRHKHQRQRIRKVQRQLKSANDNKGNRKFECGKCEFVTSGKASLLLHTATTHQGRGWRSVNLQRFLRAHYAPTHAIGTGNQHGTSAGKLANDATDLIVQRFLLHSDDDTDEARKQCYGVGETTSTATGGGGGGNGGGKKSGYFVPSVIYLPVREIVSESLRVSLTPQTPHASSKY